MWCYNRPRFSSWTMLDIVAIGISSLFLCICNFPVLWNKVWCLAPLCVHLWQIRELKKLVEEGRIKYIGLSEGSRAKIRRAHAIHPITTVQLEWSLWTSDGEDQIIPTCKYYQMLELTFAILLLALYYESLTNILIFYVQRTWYWNSAIQPSRVGFPFTWSEVSWKFNE